MNKDQLKDQYYAFIDRFGFFPTDVLVGSDAAMVIHKLRKKTSVVDVSVRNCIFDFFKVMPEVTVGYYTEANALFTEVATHGEFPLIEIHRRYAQEEGTLVDRVFVYTVQCCLDQKQLLNRDRDQVDIEKLSNYLLHTV